MPWLPFPESIKKRACRYLLQHYLGKFLQEKLRLDQLSLDLYSGKGCVENVMLDVYSVNELLTQFHVPIEMVSGDIASISVMIPWSNLLSENCIVEIKGLHIKVAMNHQRPANFADMTDSFYESYGSMSTSMQLAQECFKQQEEDIKQNKDSGSMFEGLELFAKTIENILSRVKIKFSDVKFGFEHFNYQSNKRIRLELSINELQYFDEVTMNSQQTNQPTFNEGTEHLTNLLNQTITNSCKRFQISGLDLHMTSIIDQEGEEMIYDMSPTLIASCYGKHELKVRIKHKEQIPGPKMELDFFIGSCFVFLTPKQIHLLINVLQEISEPLGGGISHRDSAFSLDRNIQAPDVAPPGRGREERFYLMSASSTLYQVNGDSQCGEMSGTSCGSSCSSAGESVDPAQFNMERKKRGRRKGRTSESAGVDCVSFQSQLDFSLLVVTVLHVDPIFRGQKVGKDDLKGACGASSYLSEIASKYFKKAETGVDGDLFENRAKMSGWCETHDHLRFVGRPVHVQHQQKEGGASHLASLHVSASLGDVDFVECLRRTEEDQGSSWKFNQILAFNERNPSEKSLQINIDREELKHSIHNDVKIQLADCTCEVDISIVDRLSTLLNYPCSGMGSAGQYSLYRTSGNNQSIFQKVLDEDAERKVSSFDVNLSCPNVKIILLFPIPDLRSEMDRRPWFKQSIREEQMHCMLHELQLSTQFVNQDDVTQYSSNFSHHKQVYMMQVKQIELLYAENNKKPPKQFLMAKQKRDASPHDKKSTSDMDFPYLKVTIQPPQPPDFNPNFTLYETTNNSTFPPSDQNTGSYWQNTSVFGLGENGLNEEISPFSKRKVVYVNEDVVMPGNCDEIQTFTSHATQTSSLSLDVYLPHVVATLHSKDFLENIYNRIGNDLLLWRPAAPQPFGASTFTSTILPTTLPHQPIFDPNMRPKFFACNSRDGSDSDYSDDAVPPYKETLRESFSKKESSIAVTLNINQGSVTANCAKGQLMLKIENGSLFYVGGYEGDSNLDYVCIDMEGCWLFYKENGRTSFNLPSTSTPSNMETIIFPTSSMVNMCFNKGRHSSGDGRDRMVTMVVKLDYEQPSLKHCVLSTLLSGATLHHKFVQQDVNWLNQITDFFDLTDHEVLGYKPPSIITQLHLHFDRCCVKYHPPSCPVGALATLHSFSLSSNMVAGSPSSLLHILIDNASLFLTKSDAREVRSMKDYVCVVEVGLLEVCLKINNSTKQTDNEKMKHPLIDLSIFNNKVKIQTCSDSFGALFTIIKKFVEEMEASMNKQTNVMTSQSIHTSHDDVIIKSTEEAMLASHESLYQDTVSDLLADAMVDVETDDVITSVQRSPEHVLLTSHATDQPPEVMTPDEFMTSTSFEPDDTQFCIIEDPGFGGFNENEPEVRYIIDDDVISYHENHFTPVLGKTDQLSAPDSFSPPEMRYSVKDLTCVWMMYGGCDFTTIDGKTKDTKMKLRDENTLMEFHLSKVRFRHEIYGEESKEAARTVLIVTEFEIRDRLQTSQINKFLYQFHSEASPKQSQANMLIVKALQYKPEKSGSSIECKLKVSLQPLRLNVDQDALDFITKFFDSVSILISKSDSDVTEHTVPHELVANPPVIKTATDDAHEAVEEDTTDASQTPLFFREIIFSPEVPIRLDYHGKHIDTDQGTLAGLLMGLGQLNCSQLKLKKIIHRHGILGVDKMVTFMLNEWAGDIRKNQLPSILGGVGPLHSVVQFFQGVHDLVVMPVEQYKRDGRIVRGLQRGTSSFGASATMATLELTNRMVWLVQKAAETTYDVVSPPQLHVKREKRQQNWRNLGPHASRHKQPNDIREGFNNALTVVRSGVSDAAYSIARVAQEEHEQKGITGAVGGVLRHLPPTLVKPVIIASEATSNVLSGMRNQILPDAKREDDEKWRNAS
uniref:autophagy-related protein 2 homolog B-like n=1 Tax=Ciona intestinalis TaxID=7719 RepID=UPI000180B908|nr:autophagy-related protein 2 homolog B-like [Ciona intestinalis]|eukprot:XP_004226712.2 autophagy-related protein 2 homolog B-like [Ciona intestinalis]